MTFRKFGLLSILALVLSVPGLQAADTQVIPIIGATGSSGLGQDGGAFAIGGTVETRFHAIHWDGCAGDKFYGRRECTSPHSDNRFLVAPFGYYENVRKVQTGQGYRVVGGINTEYRFAGLAYLLAGVEGIHSDGGIYSKDTADAQLGMGLRFPIGNSNELKFYGAYNRDIASANNSQEHNVRGLKTGLQFDVVDHASKVGLRTGLDVSGIRYGQDGIERRGTRYTIWFGAVVGHVPRYR